MRPETLVIAEAIARTVKAHTAPLIATIQAQAERIAALEASLDRFAVKQTVAEAIGRVVNDLDGRMDVVEGLHLKRFDGLGARMNDLEQRAAVPGPQGERGLQGPTGEPGQAGERGEKGERGEQGATGERGLQGERGPAGALGGRGDKGDPGEAGARGEIGAAGPRGEKGDPGQDGVRGEKGEQGIAGRDGLQGIAGRDGKDGERGPTGEKGLDGKDGRDGTLEGLRVVQVDERTVHFHRDGDGPATLLGQAKIPAVLDRGVWAAGKVYEQGDGVSFAGSWFIAQQATTGVEKPEDGSKFWRLAVKRGRDGKDGKNGPKGDPGKDGKDGILRRNE